MISKASTGELRERIRKWRGEAKRTSGWGGLLYLVPALFVLLLFNVWPPLFAVWISFWRWGIRPIEFIGLDNYQRMFTEGFITRDFNGELVVGEVLKSLIVTVYYVAGTVPVGIALAFFIAYLLHRQVSKRMRNILQPVYFIPVVISSAAVALVFQWIFDPRVGVANAVLERLGLPAQQWLQDPAPFAQRILEVFGLGLPVGFPELFAGPSTALVVIIIFTVWSTLGFNVVIYLAGLSAIPSDLYDAGQVDGAGKWALARYITWPLLVPTTLFLVIYNTIKSFQAFTPIYTLTRGSGIGRGAAGGPLGTTQTMPVLIFNNFYVQTNAVGYATAISFLLFFIILGLTFIQFRWLRSRT
jgi:multiple sugar transport system permease protein